MRRLVPSRHLKLVKLIFINTECIPTALTVIIYVVLPSLFVGIRMVHAVVMHIEYNLRKICIILRCA